MLELRSVSKVFGNLKAVNGIDLQTPRGAIHGLIGPNGSGKSTTMNLISGSLRPSGGEIRFDGDTISGLPAHAVSRKGVVRTFQLTRVYGEGSVFESARNGAIAQHPSALFSFGKYLPFRNDHPANTTARAVLEKMGLTSDADANAGALPSGKRRVLSIAAALATRPRLLLLDEPLAGLNATEKAEVVERIRELNADGITILLVEHDIRSMMQLCERITVINFGKVIAEGTPAEIGNDETVIEAYLGHRKAGHAPG